MLGYKKKPWPKTACKGSYHSTAFQPLLNIVRLLLVDAFYHRGSFFWLKLSPGMTDLLYRIPSISVSL